MEIDVYDINIQGLVSVTDPLTGYPVVLIKCEWEDLS